jgi:FlaA1/EpsC-like NDP-sugar epimerase
MIIIKFICFVYFGLYRGVWKYIGINDLVSILKAASAASVLSIIYLTVMFRFVDYSRVVFIIDWLLTLFFIAGVRILLRAIREYFINQSAVGRRALIMGAGDGGELTLREIKNNKNCACHVVGFIDDDPRKKGRRIHGIPVVGSRADIDRLISELNIEEFIIAIPSQVNSRFLDVLQCCRKNNIPCRKLTRVMEWQEWLN